MTERRTSPGVSMHVLVILVVVGMAIALASGLLGPVAEPRASGPARAALLSLTAADAHAQARAGDVVLVDIRSPDEWKLTGVPASAHAITMHQDRTVFLRRLREAMGGDGARPVALICHSGERSAAMRSELTRAGLTRVYDVPEGMVGGWNRGPGWLKRGLPLRGAAEATRQPDLAGR